MLKSVLKSKSTPNIQSDGEVSLPLFVSPVAGTYLTVENFQTAHDVGDGSVPPLSLGPVPQIMVQLPSNNPSLANLAEGSGSGMAGFFDGEEGNQGENIKDRRNNSKRPQNTRTHTLSSGSDSGSDNENEAETHLNRTEVGKTLMVAGLENSHIREDVDLTLTPGKVVALKTSTSDLTKTTVEVPRTTTIEA
jgi:hypothetical protein